MELQALRRSAMGWRLLRDSSLRRRPLLFLDADPQPFRQHTGIDGPFVMQAGRIAGQKSGDALLGLAPNGCTDSADRRLQALAQLRRALPLDQRIRLTIIDHMPQHMLASAYAAAAVHSLPSWMKLAAW